MGQHYSAPNQPGNATQSFVPKVKSVPYFVFYDGAWWGMLCLALALLAICALLAGLTLAVCGLNATVLQLRSVTGTPKQRQQALVVAGLKRHHTWMLCSLIICSVLCGETLPFVIQSLWDKPEAWVPIVISTLAIGFFAEIAPQYFVPRHAIQWGYYCWPIIWGCMWISCVLSWPIAKLLDLCSGPNEELSIFSNDELAGLIKYHERSENHGGSLGQDAARVMIGALSLDDHKIGANFSPFPETCDRDSMDKDSDIERADLVVTPSMIVNWSAVRTLDIDEAVDKAFITKIASWPYSRIPVVGEPQVESAEHGKDVLFDLSWGSKKIFGFLHIKKLIGLEINDGCGSTSGIRVRDLPLYPLPIVMDDMPAYALLNMFDLGISRMAIVIRAPVRKPAGEIVIPKKSAKPPQSPTWTGTERTNTRIKSSLAPLSSQPELPRSYVLELPAGVENRKDGRPNVTGIRCPEPLGIITFEDIVGTVLQKRTRDEADFYSCNDTLPRSKKPVGYGTISVISEVSKFTGSNMFNEAAFSNSTLRKRNPSNKMSFGATMDGANERSGDTETEPPVKKIRKDYVESSYTQNSRGGFHEGVDCSSSIQNSVESFNQLTPEELATIGNAPPPTPVNEPLKTKTVSLPTRKATSPFRAGDWNPYARRFVSAMPVLPGLRHVTPFSRQDCSSFDDSTEGDEESIELAIPPPSMGEVESPSLDRSKAFNDQNELIMPSPSMLVNPFGLNCSHNLDDPRPANPLYRFDNISGIDIADSLEFSRLPGVDRYSTEDLNSDDEQGAVQSQRAVPYDGFPPELLDQAKENQVANFASRTMPRTMGLMGGFDGSNNQRSSETHIRENSFHDDRALLPSQRRALNGSAGMNMGGVRITSFWF